MRSGGSRRGFLDRDNEGEDPKGLAKRAGAIARAGWYVSSPGSPWSGSSTRGAAEARTSSRPPPASSTSRSAATSSTRAGLTFLGAAGFNGYRAVTCKFNKKLKTHEMNEAEEAAATGIGVLGHLARAVVFTLIGLFLLKAAWEFDPSKARGLDGALMEVAQQPYGGLLLGAVAAGLISYALYCFAQARYRRI